MAQAQGPLQNLAFFVIIRKPFPTAEGSNDQGFGPPGADSPTVKDLIPKSQERSYNGLYSYFLPFRRIACVFFPHMPQDVGVVSL